jgi:hypothetical protein
MTEAVWLKSDDYWYMVCWLPLEPTVRKSGLFGVAWARHFWPLIVDQRSQAAVEVVEQYVDGLATKIQLRKAEAKAEGGSEGESRVAASLQSVQ